MQCAYSLDAKTWIDLPVGPQFNAAIGLEEHNLSFQTDGGVQFYDRLFQRDAWEFTFKCTFAQLSDFRALHDAVEGQLNPFFLTLDKDANQLVAVYGHKEAGFFPQGTGESVSPPVFTYRLKILGAVMAILTFIPTYTLANLPVDAAAGSLARVSDAPGGLWMSSGIQWVKVGNYINVKDAPYSAAGDGITDDSAAIQDAINDAATFGLRVYVPAASGYLINTPLDCHDSDRLEIFGDGAIHPAFGLNVVAPTTGSILFGNTGASSSIIDSVGSNSFRLSGITLSTLGMSTPSRVGVISGTSTRSDAGSPGGAFNEYDDIALYMEQTNTSIGFYCNNVNLSTFRRVTSLADTPFIFETGNPRAITPPFATFGADIQNDGNVFQNVSLLHHGIAAGEPALWLHKVGNLRGDVYIATMTGGPSYAGFAYAIYSAGLYDVDLKVEVDYFPSVLYTEEFHHNVRFQGTSFPNTTEIGVDIPVIAFLNGVTYSDCVFGVSPVMGAVTNSNYHYTSQGGGAGVIDRIRNSSFIFDSVVSVNVLFFNMSNAEAIPLWSNRIEGDIDAITNSLLIDNSAMITSTYRMFLNGLQIGSA